MATLFASPLSNRVSHAAVLFIKVNQEVDGLSVAHVNTLILFYLNFDVVKVAGDGNCDSFHGLGFKFIQISKKLQMPYKGLFPLRDSGGVSAASTSGTSASRVKSTSSRRCAAALGARWPAVHLRRV